VGVSAEIAIIRLDNLCILICYVVNVILFILLCFSRFVHTFINVFFVKKEAALATSQILNAS